MAEERSESRALWMKGSTLGVGVLLAVALYGMVNYLALRHYERFDWTSGKLYSLSEKSENVLAGLDREVCGVVFLSPDSELFGPAIELMASYEAASPFFESEVIDPVRNRLQAQQLIDEFGIEREQVIVIATDDDKRVIDQFDLAEYDYSAAQMGQPPKLEEFKGEQLITSAILELIEAEKPKIVLTRGHGEVNDALSVAKILLGNDNFTFEEWSPLESPRVPADADLVVVARPATRFLEAELELFTSYLERGGRMLFLLDPFGSEGRMSDPLLAEWLAGHGVAVGDDVVFDPSITMFGDASLFPYSYGAHPIVESLDRGQVPLNFYAARSVRRADEVPDGHQVTELVKTSDSGWAETRPEDFPEVAADGDEIRGPVSLAVAVAFPATANGGGAPDAAATPDDAETSEDDAETSGDAGAPEARLAVFGDIDFIADSLIQKGANSTLALNTFNWLVQREQLISIEGTRPTETRLSLGPQELSSIYLLVILVLPGLAVVAGVTVFLRRRR